MLLIIDILLDMPGCIKLMNGKGFTQVFLRQK